MGSSSCFLHSPLHQFLPPPPLSSSSSSGPFSLSSRPFFIYCRNAEGKRKVSRVPMASLHHRLGPQDIDSCKRRALLILGVSIFPFLPWKNEAFEVDAVENQTVKYRALGKRWFVILRHFELQLRKGAWTEGE
uniref:Uncharacterized protein n=1 Tax=Opuntia streptacantha TaxID=393608 RepID=A0A7C9EVV7_OPUST